MIGGLMYLTASQPDIAFGTFVCARYRARTTEKHLKEGKRIFQYHRQTINMGLWYSKDSGFELIAHADADHAGIPHGSISDYAVLQSIPCSPECKIVRLILLDHCLSYALTVIADVPAVYLQQFKRTVSKKFPNIPKRIKEYYYSIKDDVPLVSVYTTGNVLVRGMLILDAFLTAEIRETDAFKEYDTVFITVAIPMNQLQLVVST
ncbi:hypothetical protein Tco_0491022 [Tanacetum coccineum]